MGEPKRDDRGSLGTMVADALRIGDSSGLRIGTWPATAADLAALNSPVQTPAVQGSCCLKWQAGLESLPVQCIAEMQGGPHGT